MLYRKEYFLNVSEIEAFEECPSYLICKVETDALVNGLCSGETIIVPDDAKAGMPDLSCF
jgi:hypothetical protein